MTSARPARDCAPLSSAETFAAERSTAAVTQIAAFAGSSLWSHGTASGRDCPGRPRWPWLGGRSLTGSLTPAVPGTTTPAAATAATGFLLPPPFGLPPWDDLLQETRVAPLVARLTALTGPCHARSVRQAHGRPRSLGLFSRTVDWPAGRRTHSGSRHPTST